MTFGSHGVVHLPFQRNPFTCISIKNICTLVPYHTIGEIWHSGPQESTSVLLVCGQNGLGSTDQ